MENRAEGLVANDEAVDHSRAIQEATGSVSEGTKPEAEAQDTLSTDPVPAEGVAETSSDLTPAGIRKLRNQYFTVRHVTLELCGHKQDMISEPRHRNCQNCWWQFFRTHPPLCEAVHEAWTTHGKEFVINLRGVKFAEMWGRYMATVNYLKEQEANGSTEIKA